VRSQARAKRDGRTGRGDSFRGKQSCDRAGIRNGRPHRPSTKCGELYDGLTKRGVDVIHPVAGRRPGHINVLPAEADTPYDKLLGMEEIKGDFPQTDVAVIVGANDVTNLAARNEPTAPSMEWRFLMWTRRARPW
jgi:hypothetical protein